MKAKKLLLAVALVVLGITTVFAGEKTTIRLGHGQTLTSAAHRSMVRMAEEILKKSDGTFEVLIFPANQLGNERDLAEGLSQGIIDMSWISTAVMENFDSKLSLFSLPYVFRTYDHVAKVVDSEVGEYVFGSLLDSQGIRVLGFFDQGFRWVWNNIRPVHNLDDIKGLKLRAPESPVYMGTFKLLGANPTPIPWGEVYTSMQTKVVDGFEVHPESFVSNKMFEVTKYGSRTNHIYAGSVMMIREDLWQELTPEQQKLLAAEARAASEFNRSLIIDYEKEYFKEIEANGVELNNIENAELDKFSSAMKPLYAEYVGRLGRADIIETVQGMYAE